MSYPEKMCHNLELKNNKFNSKIMNKRKELITMTQLELLRYDVIKNLIANKINGTEASKQLNLSIRHIKRLKISVKEKVIKGVIHGSRGRCGNNKIDPEIIKKAKEYLSEKYVDFGPTFATEKLAENHHLQLSKEKIREIMIREGLWKSKPRRKPKGRHVWRARKEYYGEMEQFDGSYYKWLEDRNEELCLLLSVDDATGKITYGKFDLNESTLAVFGFWDEYIKKNGLPISVYLDRFSTYKVNHKNATDNKNMITQFQRATNQLGIKLISAHSPEAKGRVERMFATLQDRLVKELRLASISTIKEANLFLKEYIPKFNSQFAVIPQKNKNLHRQLPQETKKKLPQIFSIQDKRKVNNDYTIMFKGQYFQLDEEQPTTVYKKDTVTIEEHLDHSIKVNLQGKYLNYIVLPERPKKIINVKLVALTSRKQANWKPPQNHPWRKQFINNYKNKLNIFNPISKTNNIFK